MNRFDSFIPIARVSIDTMTKYVKVAVTGAWFFYDEDTFNLNEKQIARIVEDDIAYRPETLSYDVVRIEESEELSEDAPYIN